MRNLNNMMKVIKDIKIQLREVYSFPVGYILCVCVCVCVCELWMQNWSLTKLTLRIGCLS